MPLTAEEKKVRKLEKKAQKKREAEELKIKIRKDELAREITTSQELVAEYREKWYSKNYKAKFPFIKRDMEVAWHAFEHTIDFKEFIISELMDKMDEAKIQEAMSWQDYSIKLDDIICAYHQTAEHLAVEHQGRLTKLQLDAQNDSARLRMEHIGLEDYYKTIMFIMEEKFQEDSVMAQGEYVTRRDEEIKKGTHAIEVMTANLEKSLSTTVGDIRDTLQEYKESTERRRKEVEALRAKDDYYMDMIKRQEIRMARLCEELTTLQGQANERYETQLKLDDLKKDREETYTEYMEARAGLTRHSSLDNNQLMTLTTASNDVIQDLERIFEKGEKILRLGALCRRLETQEEKILPFGIPVDIKSSDENAECKSPFTLFWRRSAQVNIIKRKLEPTLKALQLENHELTECLETVLELMAMTRAQNLNNCSK